LVLLVYLAAISAAYGQGTTNNQGQSYLLQLPGATVSNGTFIGFLDNANPLTSFVTTTGPAGLTRVIAKPDGSKFYLVGTGAVQSIDGAFATGAHIINGLPGSPQAVALTPDGQTLLIGSSDQFGNSSLFFVNTNTDQITGNAVPLPSTPNFVANQTNVFCPQCFIAVSRDSQTAWVLTNSGIGARLTAINIATRQQTGQLVLSGGATSVTLSPQNLLYVTAVNLIDEINPATLALTVNGQTQLFFTPYQLHFTPDGTAAYCVNLVPTSGGSILKYTVASHGAVTWPSFQAGVNPPTFDDVIVAGNSRIFATDSAIQQLADIDPVTLIATPSTIALINNNQLPIQAAAVSNELPNAKFLFLLVANGNQTNLYRMDLATNTVSVQNQLASSLPAMQVVSVPQETNAASFITFNSNQVLQTGGAAATFMARVLDNTGLPVYNESVAFTTDTTTGAVITNAGTVTNGDGWVQANASVPNVGGTYNFTLTAGGATTVFTVTVPGGPAGPGNTSSQVQIVSGDGQIVQQNTAATYPLVILVTDTNGKPLANVPVTFQLTSGSGFVSSQNTQTDANGNASTTFVGLNLVTNTTFQSNTITASTSFGSVNFTFTTMNFDTLGNGLPEFLIQQPNLNNNFTITAPEGTPVPNAIQIQIIAQAFPDTGKPIPGVGLILSSGLSTPGNLLPAPATCLGSSNSDASGIAHCTLVAACQLGSQPLSVAVGNTLLLATGFELNIVPGGPSVFNIIAGNNQSGIAGQTLNGLAATLTDACGANVPANTPVVWAVKSGSATLVNTVSKTSGNGTVSTGVTLGATPGVVTVTATFTPTTGNPVVATFTLTNSVVISSVAAFSGSGQTTRTNQPFANPLVVQVRDSHGNGLAGVPVAFTVTVGSATFNPSTASATTDSTGKATINVNAGAVSGPIVITATAGGISTTFSLSSTLPGPAITNTSFTNNASGVVGIVPCGLTTLTGPGIAPLVNGIISGLSTFGIGPLPFTLGGLTISVDNIPAPIEAIANQGGVQFAVFQTPCEISSSSPATIVVNANGAITTVTNVPVSAAQPGIFTFPASDGKTYAVVIRAADGSYVQPNNFARRGETYYMLVTGLGETTPTVATDDVGTGSENVIFPTIVSVNNSGIPVVSSQYWEGGVGVYIVGFQIPLNAPTGPAQNLAIGLNVNGTVVVGPIVQIAGVQ
jgi:uncharacterized protein (TIGR03437 family)